MLLFVFAHITWNSWSQCSLFSRFIIFEDDNMAINLWERQRGIKKQIFFYLRFTPSTSFAWINCQYVTITLNCNKTKQTKKMAKMLIVFVYLCVTRLEFGIFSGQDTASRTVSYQCSSQARAHTTFFLFSFAVFTFNYNIYSYFIAASEIRFITSFSRICVRVYFIVLMVPSYTIFLWSYFVSMAHSFMNRKFGRVLESDQRWATTQFQRNIKITTIDCDGLSLSQAIFAVVIVSFQYRRPDWNERPAYTN